MAQGTEWVATARPERKDGEQLRRMLCESVSDRLSTGGQGTSK